MQDGISAVAPGRDYRLHSSLFGLLADGISVITTISKESIDLIVDQAEQRSKAVHIMRLSRRQHEARREPPGIASGVELGGKPDSRPARPLCLLSPLFMPTAQ